MQHPSLESLVDYIERPHLEMFADLRRHMLSCPECRNRVQHVIHLKNNCCENYAEWRECAIEEDRHDNVDIAAYVDGRLDQGRNSLIQKRINESPSLLKAALHYAAHSGAMNRALPGSQKEHRVGLVKALYRKVVSSFSIKKNFSIPGPVVFASIALFAVILTPKLVVTSEDGVSIAMYQDRVGLTFQQQQTQAPSIGFFSQAIETSVPYDGAQVTLVNKNGLEVSWPVVENALSYELMLQRIEGDERILVARQQTTSTKVTLNQLNFQEGQRYEWRLSGQDSAERLFFAQGGFVIYE